MRTYRLLRAKLLSLYVILFRKKEDKRIIFMKRDLFEDRTNRNVAGSKHLIRDFRGLGFLNEGETLTASRRCKHNFCAVRAWEVRRYPRAQCCVQSPRKIRTVQIKYTEME